MPKKIKIKLDELNVKSFATTNLRGGVTCDISVSSCGPGDGDPTGDGGGTGTLVESIDICTANARACWDGSRQSKEVC